MVFVKETLFPYAIYSSDGRLEPFNWLCNSQKLLVQSIDLQQVKHRHSFYANDVAISLKPERSNLEIIIPNLEYFGHASGLRTNMSTSSVLHIQCGDLELRTISKTLP